MLSYLCVSPQVGDALYGLDELCSSLVFTQRDLQTWSVAVLDHSHLRQTQRQLMQLCYRFSDGLWHLEWAINSVIVQFVSTLATVTHKHCCNKTGHRLLIANADYSLSHLINAWYITVEDNMVNVTCV